MLIEQTYLIFIYILFFELVLVTAIAFALFVALVVTIRKLDKKKNTSLKSNRLKHITIQKFYIAPITANKKPINFRFL